MNNLFVSDLIDEWVPPEPSGRVVRANRLLQRLGFWVRLSPPLETGTMTNLEQRMNLFHLIAQVLEFGVPGDVVELGCNRGHTAALLQAVIQRDDPSRELHVYDSFVGLPHVGEEDGDTPFHGGQMAVGVEELAATFAGCSLPMPLVHPGWFSETLETELPAAICFAHLDGDFYESILESLEHVYPRLSKGGICVIDDYADPAHEGGWNLLPGVKRACDEYLADKPESVSVLYAGQYAHGFLRKQ